MDLTGEYEDRDFIVTRGDTRISMTIGKNEHTLKFKRDSRFLIDDPESDEKLAYLLTKPLRTGRIYNGTGIYCFVLQEVVSTDYDNVELGIADYYRHFPKENADIEDNPPIEQPPETPDEEGKDLWI